VAQADAAAPGPSGLRPAITHDFVAVLWRRRWVALAAFVAVVAGVAALTASLPKVYATTAYMLVNPSRPASSDFEQTQISEALLTTYAELLQTQTVADEVARRLGSEADGEGNLKDAIAVEAVTDSQLLKVTGEASTPRAAQAITNTFTQVFQERTRELAQSDASAGRATVAEPASLPDEPVRPRPRLYLMAGALLGLLAAAGMALLAQRLDQRLDISDSMTEVLGLPILGRIPQGPASGLEAQAEGSRGARASAEAFRLVLANLAFANMGERPRTIAIVSSDEQEGKSTTALNLSRSAAELSLPTLLVEADLRRPSLAKKVGGLVGSRLGLSGVLVRRATVAEATWPLGQQGLDLLPAGALPPNPAALLGGSVLRDFDAEAREQYDMVVYDTPPLSVAADASLVSAITDGVLLVVDERRTHRKLAAQAVAQLRRVQANILGVVINRADLSAYAAGYYAADPSLVEDPARVLSEPPPK
jgi:succinoglycan biosynthesis transport protein ExoP